MSEIRVYYRDNIFEGDTKDIPSPVGVVAIAVPDLRGSPSELGRMVLHSAEWYIKIENSWFPLQTSIDLIDHVLYSNPEVVLKGRWIPDNEWDIIIKKACTEGKLPKRSGSRPKRETGEG